MIWPIIEFTPSHRPALRRIYRQARQQAFPWLDPTTFTVLDFDEVTQGERLFVAMDQQTPIGFVAWWPPDNFVHSLFVDPQYMRKGVGKSLLTACLEQMGRPATLKCKQLNESALHFYHAQGWTTLCKEEDKEGPYFLLSMS